MTYRDQLVALADSNDQRVQNVYARLIAGELTEDQAAAMIAGLTAQANSWAAALADLSLAATIMLAVGVPVAAAGILPPAGDTMRLHKAARTVLQVAGDSEVPEAIVARLARAEPLETAARAYSEAMDRSPYVQGWVRQISANACQLCTWWWREGRVWPAAHPMPSHKGCTCTPKPVVAQHIQSTGYTRRLARNAG